MLARFLSTKFEDDPLSLLRYQTRRHCGLLLSPINLCIVRVTARRLVNPPSQVVTGVRTVTTNMISAARRQDAPRFSLPDEFTESVNPQIQIRSNSVKLHLQL
jgi:hypothetical protein